MYCRLQYTQYSKGKQTCLDSLMIVGHSTCKHEKHTGITDHMADTRKPDFDSIPRLSKKEMEILRMLIANSGHDMYGLEMVGASE